MKQRQNRALVKVTDKNLKKLRKFYSESEENSPLADNFYLLEQEGRALLKDIKFLPSLQTGEVYPRIYEECVKMTEHGGLPTVSMLCKLVSGCSVREFDVLPQILKLSLVNSACKACADGDEKTFQNSVKSLREIYDIDFDYVLGKSCEVEKILSDDPAGIYSKTDKATRRRCRLRVAKIAEQNNVSEREAALSVLEKAEKQKNHIGFYLLPRSENTARGKKYIILEILFPFIISLAFSVLFRAWYLLPLLYLPVWEAVRAGIEESSLKNITPKPAPRLELGGVVPEQGRTVVVVSALLPEAENINNFINHMEQLYRTNCRGAVQFCVLADLRSAQKMVLPQDKTDIAAAVRAVKALNEKYNNSFVLAVRPRVYSKTQDEFTGWERKRGAITEFIRLIKDEDVHFEALCGDLNNLKKSKYILALDSDTALPMDCVERFVSAALHPLNQPKIDRERGVVTKGYGILCPQVLTELKSAFKTPFSRIMSGDGGFISYDLSSGERYQELFGRSVFSGKGLIHIDSYYALLNHAFPPEQVLSHDILEGSYLRTGFLSDVQVADGFPKHELSYLSRLHRWIRGDWQNTAFIFLDKFSKLSRYQLFDNLRRSVTPVCSLILLISAVFLPLFPSALCIFFGILSVSGSEWYAAFRALLNGGVSMISRLYYSNGMPGAVSEFLRGLVKLMMLPQSAFSCLDAVSRALWRLFVSRKHLLDWVVSAQSDRADNGINSFFRFIPSVLTGVFFCVFGKGVLTICGILFLCNVIFGIISGKEKPNPLPRNKLTWVQRDTLKSYAAALWKYYERFATVGEQYLAPDNVQESPVYRIAHRTSPTNIGFQLLSVLAARDFFFIDSKELYEKTERITATVERLAKFKGNLLNWYDTRTLQPLNPRYVSSVDSGNFLCSLVALEQGLSEYANEEKRLYALINRIRTIRNETDISFLYNKQRNLFHIGYDVESEKLSPSYYDLLMSESRMTSYYAVATRAVTKRHWGALGRTLARTGRRAGPVSWSGTMFEYFMPHLLLPVYENTMISEALEFCFHNQTRITRDKKIPWGVSESGFYAFDAHLNYQYKAHGIGKLGLRRNLNNELVISPYSSFLTLPYKPVSSLKNLKKLEDMKLSGSCGFYEAADFTPERAQGSEYSVVRSYMAHHVGMSFISLCNILKNNIMQNRFMRDGDMASAKCLLEEKLPLDAVVFKNPERREVTQRGKREAVNVKSFSAPTPDLPQMQLFSNGEWSLFLTDSGASFSYYRGAQITRRSEDLLRSPLGVFAVINTEDETLPLNRVLDWNVNYEYGAEFSENEAVLRSETANIKAEMISSVFSCLPGERRTVKIRNTSKQTVSGELLFYFEPSLASKREEESHPAFSKLFTESFYDEKNKVLIFKRKNRGEKSISLAVGVSFDTDFTFETERQKILKRPWGAQSLLDCRGEFNNHLGIGDAACGLKIAFTVSPRSCDEVSLFLCASSEMSEAVENLIYVRRDNKILSGAPGLFFKDSVDDITARNVLPQIFYPPQETDEYLSAAAENERGVHALWSVGVSGDVPIVLLNVKDEKDSEKIIPYLRFGRRMFNCGIAVDTVVLYKEAEAYNAPVLNSLNSILQKENCSRFIGEKGGVFLLNKKTAAPETVITLTAAARYTETFGSEKIVVPSPAYSRIRVLPCERYSGSVPDLETVCGGFKDNKFLITSKPKVPWCTVLANEQFGTLVGDSALGCTWALNSRENKLTPWFNDTVYDNRGELLLLRVGDKIYDLTLNANAEFSPDKAVWRGRAGEIKSEIIVTVPPRGMFKEITVTLTNETDDNSKMEICFYTEPVMGTDRQYTRLLKSKRRDGGIIISNPWNTSSPGAMVLYSPKIEGAEEFYCCDRTGFWRGEWENDRSLPLNDPCAAVGKRLILPPKRSVKVRFILSWAAREESALKLANLDLKNLKKKQRRALVVETPDEVLNYYVNTWLPNQVLKSRLFGRTGFYQCGGAYGFRDQLQDVFGILPLHPDIAKRQILRCARRQFKEGDVLHWYHILPAGLRGVRTRYSDDLLWMPFVTAHYVKVTGDKDILNIKVNFLNGEELKTNEAERYFEPVASDEKVTLYEHCMRAIKRASKFGSHSLPLIGGGDWNDGFNKVGINGKGESVWLAEFFVIVLKEFREICILMNDAESVSEFDGIILNLRKAIDREAWNGSYYLRAFYDDGSEMGGKNSDGCKIDILPQAFSALCDMPDKERVNKALDSAVSHLVDKENGIIRLFSPAFTGDESHNPGYVSSYPEGVRENGGQYTHAAVWFCLALIREGRTDEGYRLLRMITPALKDETYEKEPYALAGDVSGNEYSSGRGGWSLYTGAAGWYYYTAVREILGICFENGCIKLNPHLPSDWNGYRAIIIEEGEPCYIEVSRDFPPGMYVDGIKQDKFCPDGRKHEVVFGLFPKSSRTKDE